MINTQNLCGSTQKSHCGLWDFLLSQGNTSLLVCLPPLPPLWAYIQPFCSNCWSGLPTHWVPPPPFCHPEKNQINHHLSNYPFLYSQQLLLLSPGCPIFFWLLPQLMQSASLPKILLSYKITYSCMKWRSLFIRFLPFLPKRILPRTSKAVDRMFTAASTD